MKIIHRNIDFIKDKDYILECHCKINYECDTPWKRQMIYSDYRAEWFGLESQIAEFYNYLRDTALDQRTVAEIIEDENANTVGFYGCRSVKTLKATSHLLTFRISI